MPRPAQCGFPLITIVAVLLGAPGLGRAQPTAEPQPPATAAPAVETPAPEPSAVPTPEAAPAPEATPTPEAAPAPEATAAPRAPITERRAEPDYDGREDGVTVGEVLLWVPRIAVSPIYLVSEFVIRRPLGFLISTAEEEHVAEKLLEVFTFGDEGQFAIVPTAYVDLGFRPRYGLYARWSDVAVDGNKLKLNATLSTGDQFSISTGDSYRPPDAIYSVSVANTYSRADDRRFYGAASRDATRTLGDDRFGYSLESNNTRLNLSFDLWRSSQVTATVGVRSMRFDDDIRNGTALTDPANGFATPPGYDDGYTALHSRLSAALDTRRPRPFAGDGVRLTGKIRHGVDLRDHATGEAPKWLAYGGSLGGYLDVSGVNHVLGLIGHVELSEALDGAIPFTELIDIGGSGPLRGFIPGRLYGDSAAALVVEYRYPVWIWLDGSFHSALGNVFPGHLDGLKPSALRHSFGLSLRTAGSRDHSFDFTLAFGSEPLGDGGAINAVRLVIGGNSAF